jgi:uncharacterized protein (TIGR03067 family)
MNRLGLVIVALLFCHSGPILAEGGKKPSAREKILGQLQGQWQLRWSEQEGTRRDADETVAVTIKGDRWMFGKREVGVIEIDPTTSPMVIDLRMKENLAEADKGQTLEGIFKVDGDKLTCCFSRSRGRSDKQRPTEFSTKEGARMVLYEFRRIKP